MDPTTFVLTDHYGIDAVSLLDNADITDLTIGLVVFDSQLFSVTL